MRLDIQRGQDNDIRKAFPGYDRQRSEIIAEGGNDDGIKFTGAFLVRIHGKGYYRFDDGKLTKKVK